MIDYAHPWYVERMWRARGKRFDWDHPRDINEKIQWLLCYGDTSRWSDLSDKLRVRDHLADMGLQELLVPLLGHWAKPEDIDFETLPGRFVLKCNHDSGSTIVVDKSRRPDYDDIRRRLAQHLRRRHGYVNGETYYNCITPCILAEQYLEDAGTSFSTSLVDYKVWCFDGKPYCVWACYSRSDEAVYVNVYDMQWNVHPEHSVFTDHYRDGRGKVPRPKTLTQMIDVAARLSEGFPEVRVDLFEVNGRLYFSELTFACYGGLMDFYTDAFLRELGDQVTLPPRHS